MAQDLGVTVSLHPLWGCLLHQQLSHKDFLVLVESLEVHQRFKGESRGEKEFNTARIIYYLSCLDSR